MRPQTRLVCYLSLMAVPLAFLCSKNPFRYGNEVPQHAKLEASRSSSFSAATTFSFAPKHRTLEIRKHLIIVAQRRVGQPH